MPHHGPSSPGQPLSRQLQDRPSMVGLRDFLVKAEEDEVMKFIASAAVATALLAVPVKARCFDVVGRVMVERSTTDAAGHEQTVLEIGRASCRERVCQYV